MENKFTKGQWEVVENTLLCGWKHLAKITKQDVGADEAEANSKLIAAAPELLVELMNAVVSIEKLLSISDLSSEHILIYKNEIERHKNIIKKATE